ncbi:MAG TPA: SOS response-associated peptidase [Chthoniobacterales bacterium]
MCGRYRRTQKEEELAKLYGIKIPPARDVPISWNVAPQQDVLAVRRNPDSGERSLDALRWGLVPAWAKDPKVGYRTINARVETVDTSPSYRSAFKKRRCLIPADGFYEWKKVAGGKLPYAIGMADGRPFAFAGLWEGWQDPATGEWLRTCTILTGRPNALVRTIHDRMPVILPHDQQEAWLTASLSKGDLQPFPAEAMKAWTVSTRVNNPKNNGPDLAEPVPVPRASSDTSGSTENSR